MARADRKGLRGIVGLRVGLGAANLALDDRTGLSYHSPPPLFSREGSQSPWGRRKRNPH